MIRGQLLRGASSFATRVSWERGHASKAKGKPTGEKRGARTQTAERNKEVPTIRSAVCESNALQVIIWFRPRGYLFCFQIRASSMQDRKRSHHIDYIQWRTHISSKIEHDSMTSYNVNFSVYVQSSLLYIDRRLWEVELHLISVLQVLQSAKLSFCKVWVLQSLGTEFFKSKSKTAVLFLFLQHRLIWTMSYTTISVYI